MRRGCRVCCKSMLVIGPLLALNITGMILAAQRNDDLLAGWILASGPLWLLGLCFLGCTQGIKRWAHGPYEDIVTLVRWRVTMAQAIAILFDVAWFFFGVAVVALTQPTRDHPMWAVAVAMLVFRGLSICFFTLLTQTPIHDVYYT